MEDVQKEIDFIQKQRTRLRTEIASQAKLVEQENQKLKKLVAEESHLQSKALNLRDGLVAALQS